MKLAEDWSLARDKYHCQLDRKSFLVSQCDYVIFLFPCLCTAFGAQLHSQRLGDERSCR